MKKHFSLLLSLLCSIAAFPQTETGGIYYETDGNEAYVVSGSEKYNGEVIIPSKITIEGEDYAVKGIEKGAFYDCPKLIMVSIPSSVTMIKDDFDECNSLRYIICEAAAPPFISGFSDYSVSLYVPKKSYGKYRYSPKWKEFSNVYYKEMLPSEINGIYYELETSAKDKSKFATVEYVSHKHTDDLRIPAKVKIGDKTYPVRSIQDDALESFDGKSITIPKSVTYIAEMAFIGCCENLKEIIVEEGNQKYASENGALFDRHKTVLLTVPQGKEGTFSVPNSVISIDDRAFEGCSHITSINIPARVEDIDDSFAGCTSLTAINVSEENSQYGSNDGVLYNLDRTELIRVPLATAGTFTIPKYVTTIGYYAFGECSKITDIKIPNSITDIDKWAFKNCTGLTSIIIPSSVKEIGDEILGDCTNLKYIRCKATRPPIIDADITYDLNIPLYVPKLSLKKYKEGEFWMDFTNIKPSKEIPQEQ